MVPHYLLLASNVVFLWKDDYMRVILICGKAGSGKNEVAEMLKDRLGNSIVTGFSKYIKLFARELTNWDGNDDNKPRAFLQNMGDTLRSIDKDYMTKRIYEDLKVYERCTSSASAFFSA